VETGPVVEVFPWEEHSDDEEEEKSDKEEEELPLLPAGAEHAPRAAR
jgi:hypothetical protein